MSKRKQLSRAFDILKMRIGSRDLIPRMHFISMLKLVPPVRSPTLTSLLWFVLDEDMDNRIDRDQFMKLADLLNVEVSEVKDRKTIIENYFPGIYKSMVSIFIRNCVLHRYFRYTFDFLIILNAFFIVMDLDRVDWIFLFLFLIEILFKFYTLGLKEFFRRGWNIFDFIVIGIAIITTILQKATSTVAEGTPTLDALLVLRVLRLIKIIGTVERFRVIVTTIKHICPFIAIYGAIIMVFYYSFAVIGMELFAGRILGPDNAKNHTFCGTSLLQGSEFHRIDYCNNNFNNIFQALVVLFELTVVNQWHVITAGFVAVTNSAARLYFVAFHLICVIVILNIFTAFVLEAFLLEYSVHEGEMETALEKKIQELGLGLDSDKLESWKSYTTDKDTIVQQEESEYSDQPDGTEWPDLSRETDIRFHLSKSTRDVEVMLQRMFDKELRDQESGANDDS